MSYGLNSLLKKILPKRLFYRALIIVAAPIIILQLTISVVFFDSIWIKANKGMTKSLVSEVKTLLDAYKSEETKDVQYLTSLYKKNFAANAERILPLRNEQIHCARATSPKMMYFWVSFGHFLTGLGPE